MPSLLTAASHNRAMSFEKSVPSTWSLPPETSGQCDSGSSPRAKPSRQRWGRRSPSVRGGAPFGEIGGRRYGHDRIAEERARDEARLELAAGTQRDVIAVEDVNVLVRRVDMDAQRRVTRRELAEHRMEAGIHHWRHRAAQLQASII